MAIKVSGYISLRNEGVKGHLLDKFNGIRDESKKQRLREILAELDKLHLNVPKKSDKRVEGSNVSVPVNVEVHDLCTDLDRSAKLYEEIHQIVKDFPVRPHIYRRLGQAFEEIQRTPSEDTAAAIKYGTYLCNEMDNAISGRRSFSASQTMSWEWVKKRGDDQCVPF